MWRSVSQDLIAGITDTIIHYASPRAPMTKQLFTPNFLIMVVEIDETLGKWREEDAMSDYPKGFIVTN